jgi:hypothetical protein
MVYDELLAPAYRLPGEMFRAAGAPRSSQTSGPFFWSSDHPDVATRLEGLLHCYATLAGTRRPRRCNRWPPSLQEIGPAPPKTVTDATASYLDSQDAVVAWIDEACERDPNVWERSAVLFGSVYVVGIITALPALFLILWYS